MFKASKIIIIVGLILIAAGAYGLYQAYSAEAAGGAATGWAGIILGTLTTLYGFGKQASDRMSDPENAAVSQGQAEIRALIQSMGMVAVADKKVRDAEITTIAEIHEQMLGLKISKEEVREILSEFSSTFDVEARLERDLPLISPAMRRNIIQCCHLVMVSDLEVVLSEESRIYRIGESLGFSRTEVNDLISAIST